MITFYKCCVAVLSLSSFFASVSVSAADDSKTARGTDSLTEDARLNIVGDGANNIVEFLRALLTNDATPRQDDAGALFSDKSAADFAVAASTGIGYTLPPVNAGFDYQIGGDYPLPPGVKIVSRDWFIGSAPTNVYAICYINAYQTQGDELDVYRPDERSSWPAHLVLTEFGDDPNWGGEYLIDISTEAKRAQAAAWIAPMIQTCKDKGFDAVEFDNLDSWTRFDGGPLATVLPFGQSHAIAYAKLLVDLAHSNGLAAAQKNTVELPKSIARDVIGFDFAIAEGCGRWNECQGYRNVYGDQVIAIEYRPRDFTKTCSQVGSRISVVLRDVNVTQPGSRTYRYKSC